jgi:hypothetical protein
MAIKKGKDISNSKKIWNVLRYGLFFLVVRNKLAQIGLNIKPYYWVQEEVEKCKEPAIKGDPSKYILKYFGPKEIEIISKGFPSAIEKENLKLLNKGNLCIGLIYNSEIAAYTFIEFNDFVYNHRTFKLKDNEAYLFNMYTIHSFRHRNLAAYLRYQCYQLLKDKGIDTKYSLTEYFNNSSIKFKKKLNSKHLNLYLYIELFKKYHWNFLLRKYK